jgi:hypothetical protein
VSLLARPVASNRNIRTPVPRECEPFTRIEEPAILVGTM